LPLKSFKPQVLFLPKWYPHRQAALDGNFVENHAHAIKRICELKVLFVHSADKINGSGLFEFEESNNQGIKELRIYFVKANTGFSLLDRLQNLIRYRKAQELGYQRLYQNTQPDLCHVHVLARSSLLALKLKKDKQIPYVISEHWSGYLPQNGALKASRKTAFYRKVGNQAAAIHTVTQNLAKAMQAHGMVNDFTVIPNVVDTELFEYEAKPNPRKPEVESADGQRADGRPRDSKKPETLAKINILFVGNILQQPKRILDIIQIFARIATVRQDFKLHIYGEGRDEGRMLLMIRDLDLQDQIVFHGTADRYGIAKAMMQADFLFLYSEFESQPCVINEALCCGCPVVVPNIEGIVEFMQDDFGISFPRLKGRAFEQAILEMMDGFSKYDPERISRIAAEKFGESSIAQQFSVFYESVLKKP